jgi:hypothetical protein
VIWEPFILALVLGIIVSAGLYFAYLWPSVEPDDEAGGEAAAPPAPTSPEPPAPAAETDAASAAP